MPSIESINPNISLSDTKVLDTWFSNITSTINTIIGELPVAGYTWANNKAVALAEGLPGTVILSVGSKGQVVPRSLQLSGNFLNYQVKGVTPQVISNKISGVIDFGRLEAIDELPVSKIKVKSIVVDNFVKSYYPDINATFRALKEEGQGHEGVANPVLDLLADRSIKTNHLQTKTNMLVGVRDKVPMFDSTDMELVAPITPEIVQTVSRDNTLLSCDIEIYHELTFEGSQEGMYDFGYTNYPFVTVACSDGNANFSIDVSWQLQELNIDTLARKVAFRLRGKVAVNSDTVSITVTTPAIVGTEGGNKFDIDTEELNGQLVFNTYKTYKMIRFYPYLSDVDYNSISNIPYSTPDNVILLGNVNNYLLNTEFNEYPEYNEIHTEAIIQDSNSQLLNKREEKLQIYNNNKKAVKEQKQIGNNGELLLTKKTKEVHDVKPTDALEALMTELGVTEGDAGEIREKILNDDLNGWLFNTVETSKQQDNIQQEVKEVQIKAFKGGEQQTEAIISKDTVIDTSVQNELEEREEKSVEIKQLVNQDDAIDQIHKLDEEKKEEIKVDAEELQENLNDDEKAKVQEEVEAKLKAEEEAKQKALQEIAELEDEKAKTVKFVASKRKVVKSVKVNQVEHYGVHTELKEVNLVSADALEIKPEEYLADAEQSQNIQDAIKEYDQKEQALSKQLKELKPTGASLVKDQVTTIVDNFSSDRYKSYLTESQILEQTEAENFKATQQASKIQAIRMDFKSDAKTMVLGETKVSVSTGEDKYAKELEESKKAYLKEVAITEARIQQVKDYIAKHKTKKQEIKQAKSNASDITEVINKDDNLPKQIQYNEKSWSQYDDPLGRGDVVVFQKEKDFVTVKEAQAKVFTKTPAVYRKPRVELPIIKKERLIDKAVITKIPKDPKVLANYDAYNSLCETVQANYKKYGQGAIKSIHTAIISALNKLKQQVLLDKPDSLVQGISLIGKIINSSFELQKSYQQQLIKYANTYVGLLDISKARKERIIAKLIGVVYDIVGNALTKVFDKAFDAISQGVVNATEVVQLSTNTNLLVQFEKGTAYSVLQSDPVSILDITIKGGLGEHITGQTIIQAFNDTVAKIVDAGQRPFAISSTDVGATIHDISRLTSKQSQIMVKYASGNNVILKRPQAEKIELVTAQKWYDRLGKIMDGLKRLGYTPENMAETIGALSQIEKAYVTRIATALGGLVLFNDTELEGLLTKLESYVSNSKNRVKVVKHAELRIAMGLYAELEKLKQSTGFVISSSTVVVPSLKVFTSDLAQKVLNIGLIVADTKPIADLLQEIKKAGRTITNKTSKMVKESYMDIGDLVIDIPYLDKDNKIQYIQIKVNSDKKVTVPSPSDPLAIAMAKRVVSVVVNKLKEVYSKRDKVEAKHLEVLRVEIRNIIAKAVNKDIQDTLNEAFFKNVTDFENKIKASSDHVEQAKGKNQYEVIVKWTPKSTQKDVKRHMLQVLDQEIKDTENMDIGDLITQQYISPSNTELKKQIKQAVANKIQALKDRAKTGKFFTGGAHYPDITKNTEAFYARMLLSGNRIGISVPAIRSRMEVLEFLKLCPVLEFLVQKRLVNSRTGTVIPRITIEEITPVIKEELYKIGFSKVEISNVVDAINTLFAEVENKDVYSMESVRSRIVQARQVSSIEERDTILRNGLQLVKEQLEEMDSGQIERPDPADKASKVLDKIKVGDRVYFRFAVFPYGYPKTFVVKNVIFCVSEILLQDGKSYFLKEMLPLFVRMGQATVGLTSNYIAHWFAPACGGSNTVYTTTVLDVSRLFANLMKTSSQVDKETLEPINKFETGTDRSHKVTFMGNNEVRLVENHPTFVSQGGQLLPLSASKLELVARIPSLTTENGYVAYGAIAQNDYSVSESEIAELFNKASSTVVGSSYDTSLTKIAGYKVSNTVNGRQFYNQMPTNVLITPIVQIEQNIQNYSLNYYDTYAYIASQSFNIEGDAPFLRLLIDPIDDTLMSGIKLIPDQNNRFAVQSQIILNARRVLFGVQTPNNGAPQYFSLITKPSEVLRVAQDLRDHHFYFMEQERNALKQISVGDAVFELEDDIKDYRMSFLDSDGYVCYTRIS